MININCPQCGGLTAYHAESDKTFACITCDNYIAVRDIDLDGEEVWVVNADRTLGYVIDPIASLQMMAETAGYAVTSPTGSADELWALNGFFDAALALFGALEAGLPYPKARALQPDTRSLTRAQEAAATRLAEKLSDGYLLADVTESSAGLTCEEAEVFANLLKTFGEPDTAHQLLKDHAQRDDEGDSHGIDKDGNLFYRD
ncbi:hypothetical protein [Streptomyces jumonjinensis]|uniref:hypothetical protein n=1 Tax=Streptomyces jumonjinensis TaxID=1945 RepID=UPI0037A63E8E